MGVRFAGFEITLNTIDKYLKPHQLNVLLSTGRGITLRVEKENPYGDRACLRLIMDDGKGPKIETIIDRLGAEALSDFLSTWANTIQDRADLPEADESSESE